MMICLGQPRPSRIERGSGDLVLPETGTEDYLSTSLMIADRVATYHRSAAQHGRAASVRLADGQIRPDQRFYDVEYQQAAQRLAALFTDSTAQVWYQFLNNYMAYRLVDMPFCGYGKEPDPVTRECVEKRVIAPVRDNGIPELPSVGPFPTVIVEEPRKGFVFDTSLILPLAIGGIGLFVLLGGRK